MKNITIIGAGTMGNGIAHVFAIHGFNIKLFDIHKESLDRAIKTIEKNMSRQVEKEILTARRLSEESATLEELSKKYKVSRERVRQIENKAFEKLQKHMLLSAKSKNLLPVN